MIPISRSILLAAGLLAFPVAGAVAQQDKGPNNAGTVQSTTPGQPRSAAAAGAATTDNDKSSMPAANGSTYKNTTVGETGRQTGSQMSPPEGRNSASSSGTNRQ